MVFSLTLCKRFLPIYNNFMLGFMSRVLDDNFSIYALKILHILSYYDDILNFNLCFLRRVIFKMAVVLGCDSLYTFVNAFENSAAYCSRSQFCTSRVHLFCVFLSFFSREGGVCFCFGLFFPNSVNGELCFLAHLWLKGTCIPTSVSSKCINRPS